MKYLAFLKVKSVDIPLGGRDVLHDEGLDARDFLNPSNKTLLCEVNARNEKYALKKVSEHFGIAEMFIRLCPLIENEGFEEVHVKRQRRSRR